MTEQVIGFLVIFGLAFLGFSSIRLGFLPPLQATTLLWIRHGSLQASRGRLLPQAREDLVDILNEARIAKGFIAITRDRRVFFSRQIPPAFHQRLRNVILNQ